MLLPMESINSQCDIIGQALRALQDAFADITQNINHTPILTIHPPRDRLLHKNTLLEVVKDLEVMERSTSTVAIQLSTLVSQINQKKLEVQFTLAPVASLLPELLSAIFSCDAGSKVGGVQRLTHVCRSWREIATQQSELWTQLSGQPPLWMAQLEKQISNSGALPIKYTFSSSLSERDPLRSRFKTIAPALKPKLKHLEWCSSERVHEFMTALNDVAPVGLPALETLEITGTSFCLHCEGVGEATYPTVRLGNLDIPRLSVLRLDRVLPRGLSHVAASLVELTLDSLPMHYNDLLLLLTSAPLLESVSVHDLRTVPFEIRGVTGYIPLKYPSIRRLKLRHTWHGLDCLLWVLGTGQFPGLVSLQVSSSFELNGHSHETVMLLEHFVSDLVSGPWINWPHTRVSESSGRSALPPILRP